jgi:ABC-type microcin C transport system duplicated ATPase subunit YejF
MIHNAEPLLRVTDLRVHFPVHRGLLGRALGHVKAVDGISFDIPPGPGKRSYARAQAEVRQLLDGTWRIYIKDELVATADRTELGELRAQKQRKRPAALYDV